MGERSKILVIDKYDKYSYLFKGFRKNKFVLNNSVSFSKFSDKELPDFNLFFIVLYEPKDIFELLRVSKGTTAIIIASNNLRILKKLKNLNFFTILDLTNKSNLCIGLHDCIQDVFE